MATIELTKDNLEETITNNDFVIMDFWSPTCGPCQSFGPVFEEESEKHDNIVFAKVNTADEPEIAAHFQVRSVPTIMIFREQVIIFSQAGALPAEQFADLVEKAGELDMAEVHKQVAEQQEQEQQGEAG